jgi:hypothetical protein
MTHKDGLALLNPFAKGEVFASDLRILCRGQVPSDAAINDRSELILTFPNQPWIDFIGAKTGVRALFLDRPRARDFAPVANLPLYNFSTSYPSYVRDWSFLGSMAGSMRRLVLHNTLSLPDLCVLSELKNLEVLILSGGYSTDARFDSVAPLTGLKKLRVIHFASVRFRDPSLAPLDRLPSLSRLDGPQWMTSEIRSLRARIPHLQSQIFDQEA